jgi:hypothetical protein
MDAISSLLLKLSLVYYIQSAVDAVSSIVEHISLHQQERQATVQERL